MQTEFAGILKCRRYCSRSGLTWVERYDKARIEAKHMIIAALVDRIEIAENLWQLLCHKQSFFGQKSPELYIFS